jgi:hypothetical protein
MPAPPDDDHVKTVCKIGQGEACCRYLTISSSGWSCEKLTSIGRHLDEMVVNKDIIARGDNCQGRGWR